MDKLKKKIICEFIIIFACMFSIAVYLMGLIISSVYFSNFMLTTIQVIFAGVILIFMLPLYFRDMKIFDEKKKKEDIINKASWSYLIIVSAVISLICIMSYVILWILVLLWDLTSIILNIIATILGFMFVIFFVIATVIIIIRDVKKA